MPGEPRGIPGTISARAFFGMLIPQLLLATAFSGYSPDGLTDEEHLNATIAIFLRGLQPETNDER